MSVSTTLFDKEEITVTENNSTKTIRIKAETLLRLYGMKALVGIDSDNNMPTLDTVINAGLDAYQRITAQSGTQRPQHREQLPA